MVALHLAMLVPSALSLLVLGFQHIAAWSFLVRAKRSLLPQVLPSIAIVVPVRGIDQRAAWNFRSLQQQNYAGEYTVTFALEDRDDEAVPLIQASMREYDRGQMVWSDSVEGPARGKLRNLIAGYHASHSDVVVFVDSDVHVTPAFLDDVAATLAEPEVGLAFALPVCEGATDVTAAMHNVLVNASALHYAASAYRNQLNAAVGSVMAVRRVVLDDIGGPECIADRAVGIDVALGQAVRSAGYRITLLEQPARIFHAHDDPRQLWWQVHRWLVTIRSYYPATPFLLLLGAFPLIWALLFLSVALRRRRHVRLGIGWALLMAVAQLASAALINARLSRDRRMWRYLWVAVLSEFFQLPILVHSLLTTQVRWRGRSIRVQRQGRGGKVKG